MNEMIKELESVYCDMHKDVYGVKARWIQFESVEQGEAAIASLEKALQAVLQEEALRQRDAVARFERLVAECISLGAADRAAAIRWIHDAEGTDGDAGYLCYTCGLPYGYLN